MDKKKNRADPLAAGRHKLQQFRQKKADKNTDHKKDTKGSTSQGKSSKNSGKSENHEPKLDTSAVSDEAEVPSHVASGGASSDVNIGEEVVDPPQTSENAAAHKDVSVHASSSELDTLQPGNTTATSDSGAELRKEVVNSENDITMSLSTEEENVKSVDIGAAGTMDFLSDSADTEKRVTHDDASISVNGIFAASENLAEGQGVEVESGSGNVEMQHQTSLLPESVPDVSLIRARGDHVKDEDDGSHKEQFSESSAKPDVDSISTEERQKSNPAIVDSSVSPSHFSEGSSVTFDSAELEGKTNKIRSQHIGKAAELDEEKPEASIGFHNNRDHVLSTEPKQSSNADVASQLQLPESVSISGVLSHEEPCKKDTLNPSGEVSAHVHEGGSVSFLQLMDMVQGLGQDEFQVLCNSREAASSTGPGTSSLERLREELFVSSTMKDILHVQLTERSHLQNEFDHQHNQLKAELSQLRASYNAVKERNDSLVEELSECQSNLYAATSRNENLKSQLLATEAQVDDFTSKMNELQLSLEKSLLDLSEAKEKIINLQVENDTLVAIISSWNDEKKELLEEKESKNYEIKHLSSELCNCKNSAAILKAQVERLEKTVGPLTDEKMNLAEEKFNLLGEAENLKEELANCKTLVTLQEVENSNIRETLSLLKGQQAKLEEDNLHLTEETNDMEELTQRSLDPTSLRDLIEKVEGVLELESGGINFESPSLYVKFLVSQLVQKLIEAEGVANLIRKQLGAKEDELMEIQESILHHKAEIDGLRENLSQAEESLVAVRSELQERSNELEQSEQRLLSTREKLSIAVAKGKGLIVLRDNVKLSLTETSAELQRCSEELSLKDTRLQEVEAKLKTYTEAGERVEALESELSYIRNSATALRESFLLKDSLLHRIEEILEDLDLPEHFHARDILDKVEWLARSANGNSLRPSDWDQKGSDGSAGYVPSEPCREDDQTGTSSKDNLRIKFEEIQGKFYGLAEQNEMLEQSLMHRNNLIQRWESLLGSIDMPPQLKSMEVENKIEWLASTISEATHDKDTLQRKIDNLEVYCQSLSSDLEVSQKQVCDVEANLRSVDNERANLSERLEILNGDHVNLSEKAIHLEVENEKLKNQVKDLHGKLVEKLGNEEQLQTLEGDILSLRYTINDVIEEDGLQDLALASNSETLDVLMRKLIDYYKNLVRSSLPRERDDSVCETRLSNADVRSGESLGTHEAVSHGHHPESTDCNIVEATSRDITVVESHDVASLTKDLDEALHVQKLAMEERDLYVEKHLSLVAENEALDKKIIELQEFLKQEEQKSASAREKLNVAVRKGKALVQQRDSLKQTIEEMNAEHGRLKSEIINRDERLLENEKKFRELESYTVRVKALESECQLLQNHLQETENILQERSATLSMTLNALNNINIGDEGDRYDPVLKLQRITQLFQNMSTAVSSAEQESIKSRRAAELLLAELNEVQERNDSMQEELSKLTYEIQQLSRQKDAAEAAKVEAISRHENLSVVNNEEKKKLYAQVLSFGTNFNTLRKLLAGTNSCLADIFTMNVEFLHHLKANMESCAKQTGTKLSGWPQVSTGDFLDKEIFSRLGAALSNVNLHEISNGGNIIEICGSLSRNLDQLVADVSHLEGNVSKHLESWHEQVNIVSNSFDTFFKSIGTGTDSEISALRERVSLLHGACSSVLAEIESRKAELVGNDNFNMSLHQVAEDFSSMESVRSMVNRLSSAVKELVLANAETVERNEREMKVIIANLQRELHEKDIQSDRMCNELVGQLKEAQAGAKIFAEDLQSASARMRDMQDQVGILVRERDSLKERVKELQEVQVSHSELQEKVTSLSNLLAAKDQEIEALMQALDEEESQMEDLKHRVTELEQEVQQKNLDLQKAEASRGKISKKLSITVDKFDELHHLSENLLAEIEKLQQQVQDRDTEVSFLRQEVTRCTNEALVASQMDTKRDSEKIQPVLSWFDRTASLLGLEDSPSTDAHSHVNHYMETLERKIASILSEIEELRLVGQNKDSLLEAERSRVAELRQKEATLEKILNEKESQPNTSTSEIVEVEPLINKRTTNGASIPSQVRSLRKGNNDQVAISIDADQPDHSLSLEEDDDKAHGFRSLTTSRIIPRFTRPVTNMIDGLWVSCDRTLMRQPALRLGIMIYWAILHALLASFVV